MSRIFRRTFIRPHEDIDFWSVPAALQAHMQTTYIDTGKCLRFREMTLTDSTGLVCDIVSEWTDDAITELLGDNTELTQEVLTAVDATWAGYLDEELEYNEACEIVNLSRELE